MARALAALIGLVAASLTIAGCSTRAPAPVASARIKLERSACYGTCPDYSIEIADDGSATYQGNKYVAVIGSRRYRIPPSEVQSLVAKFYAAGFWSLADRYESSITDNPTYTLSLTIGGKTKTVVDYVGSEVGMPRAVTDLELAVDKVAGTDRWIKGDNETVPSR